MVTKKRKKWKMPSAFIIIFGVIIILVMMTWIPGLAETKLGIIDIFIIPFKGLEKNIPLIGFILAIGAFLNIVVKTRALEAGLQKLVRKMKGKEIYLIPICMTLFSIGGTTFGMAEETLAFYPILMPIFIASGFDPLTGLLVIMFGAGSGAMASTLNPFKIAVAVDTMNNAGVTDVTNSTGIVWRTISWIVITGIFQTFVIARAIHIRKNPKKSVVYARHAEFEAKYKIATDDIPLTKKRKAVLWIFTLTFILMIIALITWHKFGATFFKDFNDIILAKAPYFSTMFTYIGNWYMIELSALFLIATIIIGLIHWKGSEEFMGNYLAGSKDFLGVGLIIALSGGVGVVLSTSGMGPIIVEKLTKSLGGINPILFVFAIYFVLIFLSFFIPSSSALAKAAFPIIGPIANTVGVVGTTMLAFSFASGLINLVSPTSGFFMAILMMTGVKWNEYVKTAAPCLGIAVLACIILLLIGTQVPV